MKVTRTFNKTGQALFAVERITCHNQQRTIVYDCGGNNVNEVKRAINAIKDVTVIDAVFISHYHTDHINGLRELLKSFTVKNLFLPLLDPFQELALRCTSPKYQKHKLYDNPKQFLASIVEDLPRIHMVMTEGDESEPGNDQQDNNNPQGNFGDDGFDSVIHSGTEIDFQFLDDSTNTQNTSTNISCWRFIPFNLKTMTTKDWQTFLKGINLPEDYTPQQVKANWGSVRTIGRKSPVNALKKMYGWKFEDINEYSMTLYSGPTSQHRCSLDNCTGCLYYGDYNAKKNFNSIHAKYQKFWGNIGVVQVPHHGSEKNFDNQIIVHGAIHIIPNDNSLCYCKKTGEPYPKYASPYTVEKEISQKEKVDLVTNDRVV